VPGGLPLVFENISSQILALTGSLNIWLVISIFILFPISEFGLSIPYLMESMWILVGYHARHSPVFAAELPILLMAGVFARSGGATAFYSLIGLGRSWILKVYRRFFGFALNPDAPAGNSLPARVLRRLNLSSPFTVAFGRLVWLKIPINLTMSVRKDLRVLLLGTALSSLIWDLLYITIGAVVGSAELKPYETVLYSVAALAVIYALLFLARRLLFRRLLIK
jgi:membrane-associated protein